MNRKTAPVKYITAFVLSFLYLLFHLHFMTSYLDWDQYGYYRNIEKSVVNGRVPVFNPHHLHMELGGEKFHQFMVEKWGSRGFVSLMFNLRLRSLLAACLGIFFLVLFLTDSTGRLLWGVIGGLLLGVSHGYLSYATKLDTGIFPALGIILFLWLYNRLESAEKGLPLWTILGAFVLFAGIMFHQMLGIACATFCVSLIVPDGAFRFRLFPRPFSMEKQEEKKGVHKRYSRRFFSAFFMALLAVIFIIGAYFYAGKTIYNLPFSEEVNEPTQGLFGPVLFQKWLFIYETADAWGKGLEEFNPNHPFRGYTDAFLSRGRDSRKYPLGKERETFAYNLGHPDKASFVPNLLAWFTIGVVGLTVFLLPFLLRRYKNLFLFLFSTTVILFVFSTYWEPYYYEFWIVPSILVISLGVLILNFLGEVFRKVFKEPVLVPFYVLLLSFSLCLGSYNFHEHVMPFSLRRFLEIGAAKHPKNGPYLRYYMPEVYRNPHNPYKGIYDGWDY